MTNDQGEIFEPTGDGAADGGRTVLGRLAAIMDAFDMGEQVLSLAELSKRSELPKSTVHRLAEQLRAIGWLERDHNNAYRVGMRIFELGGLALQRDQLRDTAFPLLQDLAAATGLAVQLGVLDRGEVVYLERIVSRDFSLPTRLGGRMPAHCTGLGKAMLAYDDLAAEEVMSSPMQRLTDHTITEASVLRAALAEVRATGVARDVHESVMGLVCVAGPIRNSGRAIAAVSVTGPADQMDWDVVSEAVRNTAAGIWNARFSPSRDRRAAPRRATA